MNLQLTVKYERGSVIVWCYTSAQNVGNMHCIDEIINQDILLKYFKNASGSQC